MRSIALRSASAFALAFGHVLVSAAWAQQVPTEPASPQTAPATQAGPPEDARRDVVIVTASKREETVQDVAIAITAVTSEERDLRGITSITDLTNVTPGLSFDSGSDRIFLRGVGRYTNNFGADPGIANYSDGIYQAFAVTAGRNNIFVDRIEVLRGPQGTVYGRNSVGGVINVISKRPTDEFQADVVLGAGNYDYSLAAFSVSGPLTDDIRGRLTASIEEREGYFDNVANGLHEGGELGDWNLELQLEGDIGDRFSWWLKGTTLDWSKSGPPGGQTSAGSSAPYLTSFLSDTGIVPSPGWAYSGDPLILDTTQLGTVTTNPTTTDVFKMNANSAGYAIFDAYHEFTAEAIYETDSFDIKYLGGYVFYDYVLPGDNDGTPVQSITYLADPGGEPSPTGSPFTMFPDQEFLYKESRAFFSNEINLISTTDDPLQWLVGLYQYYENSQQPVTAQMPNDPSLDFFMDPNTGDVHANRGRQFFYTNNTNQFNAYGAYGQVDYRFNDQWKGTAGLRYSLDNKEIKEEASLRCAFTCSFLLGTPVPFPVLDITPFVFNGVAPGFTGPQPGVVSATDANPTGIVHDPVSGVSTRFLKHEWNAVTGTLGLEYTPSDDAMLFARYSRGYKSGGFNADSMSPLPLTKKEIVDTIEFGWKQEVPEWNLTANTAIFYYDYKDAQIPLAVQPTTGPAYESFVNIPKVKNFGVELETTWRPLEDLEVLFTYAYLDATVEESGTYLNATTGLAESLEGNTTPLSAKNKVSANVRYTFDLGEAGTLTPSVSYYWRDKFSTSIFNNPLSYTPTYDQTDARLIWRDADDRFTVTAWVKNLFDELGYDSITAALRRTDSTIYQTITPTPPRLFGIELKYHFQ
ncbi:MAG TPA: TonB-dependent receptor [Hyphomonadaceae bacterium]|nr:TonB-dependent receptor [Hyphomonadaceae bacterium]